MNHRPGPAKTQRADCKSLIGGPVQPEMGLSKLLINDNTGGLFSGTFSYNIPLFPGMRGNISYNIRPDQGQFWEIGL